MERRNALFDQRYALAWAAREREGRDLNGSTMMGRGERERLGRVQCELEERGEWERIGGMVRWKPNDEKGGCVIL